MAIYDLVFEGGGAKGAAFAGALEELEWLGHSVRRVIGTSAGAVTAMLLAAGYRAPELRVLLAETDAQGRPRFASFLEQPRRWEWIFSALTLVTDGGLYSDRNVVAWLREKLQQRGHAPDLTLAAFARHSKLDLSVVAADSTDGAAMILNHRTAPDLPVCWAVRMSMSIPFIWPEVTWRPEWGRYRGRDVAGHAIVDGGTLSNFPIRYVATLDGEVAAIMGDADVGGARQLGMMIDESAAVDGQPDSFPRPGFLSRFRTAQRVTRILDMMMGAHDNEMIHRFEKFIVRLPARGYGVLEFDLKGKRLDDFLHASRLAVRNYFARLEQ
jgi:NTE family protein